MISAPCAIWLYFTRTLGIHPDYAYYLWMWFPQIPPPDDEL